MEDTFGHSMELTQLPGRGCCEIRLKNFSCLKREDIFQTDIFRLGGFEWRVVLFRSYKQSYAPEHVSAQVLSCNADTITCQSTITFVNQKHVEKSVSESKWPISYPFASLSLTGVDTLYKTLNDPENGFICGDQLLLKVLLTDIHAIQPYSRNPLTCGDDMRMVNWDIIDSRSVASRLSRTNAFGIASTVRKRTCVLTANVQVLACCVVYSAAGQMVFKQCLNTCEQNACFGDLCNEGTDGQLWITTFVEWESENHMFEKIDKESIVVFCKFYKPGANLLEYVGHLVVQKTMLCSPLLRRFARMAGIPDWLEYNAYVEEAGHRIGKITQVQASLTECGLFSGSCIIVAPRGREEMVCENSLRRALDGLYKTPRAEEKPGEESTEECNPHQLQRTMKNLAEELNPEPVGSPTINHDESPIESLSSLTEGTLFANRFLVERKSVRGKPHLVFAVDTESNYQRVVLKFYTSRMCFENSKRLHLFLSSDYVCRLLAIVDDEGMFPPCLVFERGTVTLEQWMQKARPRALAQKDVLYQARYLIPHCDSNIVHCDIKPSNIMFFSESHSWKMLDVDSSVRKGNPQTLHFTPMYAPPEVIRAQEDGTDVWLETSADMWSFGIVAFEVLTGNRFYGPGATAYTVRDCLTGRRQLSSLDCIEERQARRLLANLICLDPRKRWTARRALDHALFRSADDSTMKATGMHQTTEREVRSANLMVAIVVESFLNTDTSVPFHRRNCQDVFTISDEYLRDPVFILHLNKEYRLRILLKHRHCGRAPFHRIRSVVVQPADGILMRLNVEEVRSEAGEHEVVAHFEPQNYESTKLTSLSPLSGEIDEKYVRLDVCVEVETETSDPEVLQLKGSVMCKMVAADNPLRMNRAAKAAKDAWRRAPQWIRDGARGAVFLTKTATPVVAGVSAGDPSTAMFGIKLIKACFKPCILP